GATAPINRVAPLQFGPEQGFYARIDSLKLDAAVSLSRSQYFDGDRYLVNTRAAFEDGTTPVQAGKVTVNRTAIPWYDCSSTQEQADTYSKSDSTLYGSEDSVTLSYSDFKGESATITADVAKRFGTFTFEHNGVNIDTISASSGYTLRYEYPNLGDSIMVWINTADTAPIPYFVVPDTGAIVFASHQLPYNVKIASLGYEVQLYRMHYSERTSPTSKRIGFISTYEADCLFEAKP
ncbi:MAG TPA: hypothetical protein VFH95_08310, partial [Candidatus Kapabacteria bacterium]|nr:hypothetical protein [Candidatus Kapabacteria bacterium]